MRQLTSSLVLLCAVGIAQPVAAQGKDKDNGKKTTDSEKGPDKQRLGFQDKIREKALQRISTEFLEASEGKNYEKVEDIYERGFKKFEKLKKKKNFIYRYCEAVYALSEKGKKKKARLEKITLALEDLIDDHPKYTSARFLLAKCLAKQKKPTAKDQLLAAAKLGLPVLREISDKKNAKLFGHLLEEPRFIVKIMKVGQIIDGGISEIKNPFTHPLKRTPRKPEGKGLPASGKTDSEQTAANNAARIKLENDIERLFREIEDHVERSEYEGLLAKFRELNGLMNT